MWYTEIAGSIPDPDGFYVVFTARKDYEANLMKGCYIHSPEVARGSPFHGSQFQLHTDEKKCKQITVMISGLFTYDIRIAPNQMRASEP
jgi:hypothetical protein